MFENNMAAKNKRLFRSLAVLVAVLLIAVMASCTTSEKQTIAPKKDKIKFESRSSLLQWYDVTHKSYYGLKGAVKRLVVRPATLKSDSDQEVSDEWEYLFSENGRLNSKFGLGDGIDFKTLYSYSGQGLLSNVASYKDNKLWRSSEFIHQDGLLIKIQFSDKITNEQNTAKVSRQIVADGWFEIQKPVMTPGLPAYTQYLTDGTLVWSNRGDINNGLGELYYLRTVDSVTSSSVADRDTASMQGRGGYRYVYREDGLLQAVESYNAHANRLFHRTTYEYNDLALLLSEKREVKDTSPFNQATNEYVIYKYQQIDDRGNWLKRKLTVKSGFQTQIFIEARKIEYY